MVHPSANAKNPSLNGSATIAEGTIIIPIDMRTAETTMSMIKKGRKIKKPILKARVSSEIRKLAVRCDNLGASRSRGSGDAVATDSWIVSQTYRAEAAKLAALDREIARPFDKALTQLPATRHLCERWSAQVRAAREAQDKNTQMALSRVSRWRAQAVHHMARDAAIDNLNDRFAAQKKRIETQRRVQNLHHDVLLKISQYQSFAG